MNEVLRCHIFGSSCCADRSRHTVTLSCSTSAQRICCDCLCVCAGQLQPWHHLVGDGLISELAASSDALAPSHPDNGTSPHPDAHFAALLRQSAFLHGRTALRTAECATHATTRPRFFNLLPPVRPAAAVLTAATRKNSKVRGRDGGLFLHDRV